MWYPPFKDNFNVYFVKVSLRTLSSFVKSCSVKCTNRKWNAWFILMSQNTLFWSHSHLRRFCWWFYWFVWSLLIIVMTRMDTDLTVAKLSTTTSRQSLKFQIFIIEIFIIEYCCYYIFTSTYLTLSISRDNLSNIN